MGLKQAEKVAERLKDFNIKHLISSPQKRAMQTAHCISESLSLDIIKNKGLVECNFGEFEGKNFRDIESEHPNFLKKLMTNPTGLHIPGAEPFLDFYNRIKVTFTDIVDKYESNDIAIVAHGGVISVIVGFILNMAPDYVTKLVASNASISVITKKEIFILSGFNDICHLNDS